MPMDFGLCSTCVWSCGWVNIKNMVWSVSLCCDKLLLEELTSTVKASFQNKFQWCFSILATQHSAFGLNCTLNPLLFIFSRLCVLMLFLVRNQRHQSFLSRGDILFASSFQTHKWADSESREQWAMLTFSLGFRSRMAVVCIYCFSIGGNRHTTWKMLINVCFQKDSLEVSSYSIHSISLPSFQQSTCYFTKILYSLTSSPHP